MGWMGKLVGGTIGFVLGGPIGAIAGTVFGHGFDKSTAASSNSGQNFFINQQRSQMTFFVGIFSMLAKIVQADGQVTKSEITSIENFMAGDLRLDPESRRIALQVFNSALHSNESFESFAVQFYEQFHNQPQMLEMVLDILVRVSAADKSISPMEENLILKAVNIFNLPGSYYTAIKKRYSLQDTNKYYSVLGCSPDDSTDAIKKRYRTLVSEYHPDKIASKGLPEEFTKFASDKFREIQEAYDAVRKERNF